MSNETSAAVAANTSAAVAANKPPAPQGSSLPAIADGSTKQGKVVALSAISNGQSSTPAWVDDKGKIDEIEFSLDFCKRHKIVCVNNTLCDLNGVVKSSDLQRAIMEEIAPYVRYSIANKVDGLMKALRLSAPRRDYKLREDLIHFHNGTYVVGDGFKAKKMIVPNRLPVRYDPDAPKPEKWLAFLNDLLEPEDQETLAQYMGYTMIPSTKLQKALFLTGAGKEGKSVTSVILSRILGDNATPVKIESLCKNRFALAALENKLACIEDDVTTESIKETDIFKSLVTAAAPLMVEQKNQPAHPALLYARYFGCSNANLSSLHDRSDGFFRRLLTIKVKSRPENRVDNPHLISELSEELPGITKWCVEALERLVAQDFKITISKETADGMKEIIEEQDSTIAFLDSDVLEFDPDAAESSRLLFSAYQVFCEANCLIALKEQSFLKQLALRAEKYHLHADKNVRVGSSVVRGYRGVRIKNSTTVKQAQNKVPSRASSGIIDDDPVPSGNLEDEWIDLPDEDDDDDIMAELAAR